jgi:hypothetical protein
MEKDCEPWLLPQGEGGSVVSGLKPQVEFQLNVLPYQTYVGGTPFCKSKFFFLPCWLLNLISNIYQNKGYSAEIQKIFKNLH